MIKVKICGITNLEDAKKAIEAGADALGFVFYDRSRRYVSPGKAKEIIKNLPGDIKKIGVFVNTKEKEIKRIAKLCCLDILQLHGDESPEFCQRFKNYKVVKAFRIKDKNSLKNINKYRVWGLMFDTYKKNLFGGTGRKFKWQLIEDVKLDKKIIFLSGGLNVKNVKPAIKLIRPDWVDVSSSVEVKPRKKDYLRAKEFIEAVRS